MTTCPGLAAPRSIIERLHDLINARRLDALDEILVPDVVMRRAAEAMRGAASVRDYLQAVLRQMPGLRVQLQELLVETPDAVVALSRYADSFAQGRPTRRGPGPGARRRDDREARDHRPGRTDRHPAGARRPAAW